MMYFQPIEEYQIGEEYYKQYYVINIWLSLLQNIKYLSTTGQSTNFVLTIDLMSKKRETRIFNLKRSNYNIIIK
ncbi:unnamed protein product [Paramecium pentaurelia]|uniref:Uncharacterized protein n=1 Tax=Paramecium pentaurelia TaxID=43138 RepID=A0A8S1WFY5_9CILI|nr:unnamed protein product [Paramecium pentaurelia]